MRRLAIVALPVAAAACMHAPPNIGTAAGAPPAPNAYWTPPPAPAPAPVRSAAATPAPQGLTLSTVVDLALRNNPATRVSWTQARAAADQYGASRGALFPLISGTLNATRSKSTTSQNGIERTQYGPGVSLSYMVLDFGGRNGTIESARTTAIAADYAHNVVIQNTILQTEASAFGFLGTRALRDAERAAIDEAAANLAAAEERHRVGLATIADVLQARTARAQQELNLETLEGQLRVSQGALAIAMGLPADANIDVPDVAAPDSATVTAVTQSVDTIIDLAVRNRPDLAAAQADAAHAAAQLSVTKSAGRPSLAFGATGSYLGSNVSNLSGRNYTLNFGLSIPIFSGYANEYAVRAAAEQVDAANARTEVTRQQIELQVFTSYYALQTATERVRSAANLLASAEESEAVARGRYTEGVGSIVDLLIAQSTLADARAQSLSARWSWRTTLALLAHDAGVLDIHGESRVPLVAAPGGGR